MRKKISNWQYLVANLFRLHSEAITLTLLVILDETTFARRFFLNPDGFYLSILNSSSHASWAMGIFFEVLLYLSLPLLFFRRSNIGATWVILFSKIVLINLDLVDRGQFEYLVVGVCLAFIIRRRLLKMGHDTSTSAIPLALFLGSIYGFGCLHKILNFHEMLVSLPAQVFRRSTVLNEGFCSTVACRPLEFLAWSAIPADALLCYLTVVRGFTKLRLIFSFIFHFVIAILLPFLPVSVPMLSVQLMLALQQNPEIAKSICRRRSSVWACAGGLLMLVGTAIVLVLGTPFEAKGALRIIAVSLACMPLGLLFIRFISSDPEKINMNYLIVNGRLPKAIYPILILILAFGFSPMFLDKPYSILNLGWSQVSAATHYDVKMNVPDVPCFAIFDSDPHIHVLIRRSPEAKSLQILTSHRKFMRQIVDYLRTRKECSNLLNGLVWTDGAGSEKTE